MTEKKVKPKGKKSKRIILMIRYTEADIRIQVKREQLDIRRETG